MALQLIYSLWQQAGVEQSLCAVSKDLTEEDTTYILRHTVKHVAYAELPHDDENVDLACTSYLHLPSGTVAIARTGYYSSTQTSIKDGFIVHAYIAEKGETISPFLYALNTCFKQVLTKEELESYSSYKLLPNVPFPRPQFVLNQREIQKFFSKGRQRVLSQLLQALIDGHRSKRVTILNEKYSFLKYWFYAIHCCLPEQIKKDITFVTSAHDRPEDCELVCGAAQNTISTINEMVQGNFVFDHVGGPKTENIEAVKYPVFIAKLFVESVEKAFAVSKTIHNYMSQHHMTFSTSVGIMKLIECDFEWFDSAYDIQFYLGKIGWLDKEQLESIVSNLWISFKERSFRFLITEQALPLLSYVFKNSDSCIKREIIEYVDHPHEYFGLYQTMTIKDYYTSVLDKLGFIYDFLPSALLRNNQFDAYCEYLNQNLNDLCVLLYVIIDRYSDLTKEYGVESVYYICREIFLLLIEDGDSNLTIDFCRKAESLPDAFVEQVVVRGVWMYSERVAEIQGYVDEDLVFAIMEEFIKRPKAAAALLMVFARKGRYGENTVSMYMNLCRQYPNETATIDNILSQRETFSAFVADMSLQKFMEKKRVTLDDITYFFYNFYLKESDKNLSFESKIQELLESLSPVLQIEVADHLLRLFSNSCSDYHNKRFVRVLASYIVNQSVNDIYDYYANSDVDIRLMTDILLGVDHPISNEFYAAILCVDLKNIVLHDQNQVSVKGSSSKLFLELSAPYIVSELPPYNAENQLFLDRLYRYLLRAMILISRKRRKMVMHYSLVIKNFLTRTDFQDALITFITAFEESDENRLDSILVSVLLLKAKDELYCDRVYKICKEYLLSGSLEKRKEHFRTFPDYVNGEEEKEQLKKYLIGLYFSDLNFFQKLMTVSPKNLFR